MASDHQRGDIDEDDESSGPRSNWCGIGPGRSGSASPGAVVGKSRHRHCDPGRFEGLDNGSAVASALAPPLASPSLVNPSDTILTGPPPRARFYWQHRDPCLAYDDDHVFDVRHAHVFSLESVAAHSWRVQVATSKFQIKNTIQQKHREIEADALKAPMRSIVCGFLRIRKGLHRR